MPWFEDEWNGVEWSGMERNGVEWSGMRAPMEMIQANAGRRHEEPTQAGGGGIILGFRRVLLGPLPPTGGSLPAPA